MTFSIAATNLGSGDATTVVVRDLLGASFTFVSATPSTGTYDSGTGLWAVGTLMSGLAETLDIVVTTAAGTAGTTPTNSAALQSLDQVDSNPSNDTGTASVNVVPDTPPTVAISAPTDGSVYDPGDPITFTATASDVEDGDLTAAISWSSNVDGIFGSGGSVTTSALSPGTHVVTASVTDAQGTTTTDIVTLIITLVTTPGTLNVPFGGTASLPITLAAPAPVGGLDLTVTTSDGGIAMPISANVTIPQGALSANATLSGVSPGTATITVTSVGFGSSTTSATVVAELDITPNSISFAETFSATATITLKSVGVPIAAPSGGLVVTLTSGDPGCVAAPATATIPGGLVSTTATLTYGGSTSTSCTTTVTVSAPPVTQDVANVTVTPSPLISLNPVTVGTSLQLSHGAFLGTGGHGGVTVRVTSSNPAVMQVSPNASTAGTDFIDVVMANGSTFVPFYVQGVEGATGTVTVTLTAPGFTDGSATITVVQPGVVLTGLGASTTTLSPDDAFYARIGTPSGNSVSGQAVRAGGSTLTVTISNSNVGAGVVKTSGASGGSVTVQILPGQFNSPTSVAAGGVAFDPVGTGSSTVTSSIPGFITQPSGTVVVVVTAPLITASNTTVGAGLQRNSGASLGASQHGGVTVRVTSSNPAVMQVSPNASTAGTDFIDVVMANGSTFVPFYVQGVEGATGTVTVTMSAPGFTDGSATITVVQPGVVLTGLGASTTTLSPDDAFYARIGTPSGNSVSGQAVRAGGSTLTVTISSSNVGAGVVYTSGASGGSVTVQILPGQFNSPTSVAAGGVAFDPVGTGSSTVTSSIPGFITQPSGTLTVTVN